MQKVIGSLRTSVASPARRSWKESLLDWLRRITRKDLRCRRHSSVLTSWSFPFHLGPDLEGYIRVRALHGESILTSSSLSPTAPKAQGLFPPAVVLSLSCIINFYLSTLYWSVRIRIQTCHNIFNLKKNLSWPPRPSSITVQFLCLLWQQNLSILSVSTFSPLILPWARSHQAFIPTTSPKYLLARLPITNLSGQLKSPPVDLLASFVTTNHCVFLKYFLPLAHCCSLTVVFSGFPLSSLLFSAGVPQDAQF